MKSKPNVRKNVPLGNSAGCDTMEVLSPHSLGYTDSSGVAMRS
mgnify:CR=1 FL=1